MQLEALEQHMVDDFRVRLDAELGEHLIAVRVFGSRARGSAHRTSDLDVLVLTDMYDRALRRKVIHLAEDVNETHEWAILLSPLVMSAREFEEMRSRERRLALDIDREGLPV